MKKLRITLTEKDKRNHSFNLYNFRDEIVNFMYKKTIADSSRNSMVFYILVFFLVLKKEKVTLLEDLFASNIPKLEILNKNLKDYEKLKKGVYAKLVEEAGLKEVFQYDVLFLLITAVEKYSEIKKEFEDFFKDNPSIASEYKKIHDTYREVLEEFSLTFKKNLIEDDRVDDRGEYHDLSKSVYRTIKMRSSRRLDLTLHKHAEVKKVTSQSPIVVEVIQNIDPQILTQIWDSYNLGEYVKTAWKFTEENWWVQVILGNTAYDFCASKWLKWKSINGAKERKAKDEARREFKEALEIGRKNEKENSLIEALTKSVISSNEYLQSEVKELKKQLKREQESSSVFIKKDKQIAELQEKIDRLENIDVKVEEIE